MIPMVDKIEGQFVFISRFSAIHPSDSLEELSWCEETNMVEISSSTERRVEGLYSSSSPAPHLSPSIYY